MDNDKSIKSVLFRLLYPVSKNTLTKSFSLIMELLVYIFFEYGCSISITSVAG